MQTYIFVISLLSSSPVLDLGSDITTGKNAMNSLNISHTQERTKLHSFEDIALNFDTLLSNACILGKYRGLFEIKLKLSQNIAARLCSLSWSLSSFYSLTPF